MRTLSGIWCKAQSSIQLQAVMVGLGGFEPPTSPLSGVRSNQLSYRPEVSIES